MTGMTIERDFRKLTPATQAELRRVAVAMVRAGRTRIEAAEAVGVHRGFVGRWVQAAEQAGEAALAGGRRGRRPGEHKALSAAQEEGLRSLIRGCPDRFGLSFALWTRPAVRALIARETGVWLTLSVVGRYLRAWGFTAPRRLASPHHPGDTGTCLFRRAPLHRRQGEKARSISPPTCWRSPCRKCDACLWHLVWGRPPDHDAACACSRWRRRHQQRARQSHWKRRTSSKTRL